MTPNYEILEIKTTGRYQCITSVSVNIYPNAIVAISDAEHITQFQMRRALTREFPMHTFIFNKSGGKYTHRADAERFANDGL